VGQLRDLQTIDQQGDGECQRQLGSDSQLALQEVAKSLKQEGRSEKVRAQKLLRQTSEMAMCISLPRVFLLLSLRVGAEDFRFNPTKESECFDFDLEFSFASPTASVAAMAVAAGSNFEAKRRDSKRRAKKLTKMREGGERKKKQRGTEIERGE
jgi:hypothetical protein